MKCPHCQKDVLIVTPIGEIKAHIIKLIECQRKELRRTNKGDFYSVDDLETFKSKREEKISHFMGWIKAIEDLEAKNG